MGQLVETNLEVEQAAFLIAGWSIDPATLRIHKSDKSVKLEPKVMAVLEYLAVRPGQVISRQELEESVWAGTVVGYDAISNAIIKLRKAFGDDAHHPRVIETIPKTGYRLISPVESPAAETDSDVGLIRSLPTEPVESDRREPGIGFEESARGHKIGLKIFVSLAVLVAVSVFWFKPWESGVEPASESRMAFSLPDKPSIAVLPFSNISADAEQEYFVDGMTEDLITDLSKLSGLFVVARNSVFTYKDKPVKIRDVAEELGVHFVLEGSVQRVGDEVRINAQLIDALSGGHIWAERYDGELGDIFDMRDKITRNIVSGLALTLTSQEQINKTESETNVPKAYEAFLRGWERYRLGAPEDLAKAVVHFEKALSLDPNYARANSALASTYWNILSSGWSRRLGLRSSEIINIVRQNLAKAKERPSPLTYQLASERAALLYRKAATALAEAERAIALDVNDPAGHFAMAAALIKDGQAAEAEESIRIAMRLDPLYPAIYLSLLGQAQFAAGNYEQAAKSFEQAAERNQDNDWTFVYLAATYGQFGREAKAARAMQTANELRAKSGWGEITMLMANSGKGFRSYFKWFGDYKSLRAGLLKAGAKTGLEWKDLVDFGTTDFRINGATAIDARTAKDLFDRGVPFVDVHYFWHEQRIPGAEHLDVRAFEFNEVTLPKVAQKTQELVIYTSIANDSKFLPQATALAVSWGYEKVYFFQNGLHAWKAAGYPIETDQKKY